MAAGAGGADLAVEVCFSQAARRTGSFTGRLAFMGKAVCGRLRVDFSGLALGRTRLAQWGSASGASGIRSSWCCLVKASGIRSSVELRGSLLLDEPNLYCIRGGGMDEDARRRLFGGRTCVQGSELG